MPFKGAMCHQCLPVPLILPTDRHLCALQVFVYMYCMYQYLCCLVTEVSVCENLASRDKTVMNESNRHVYAVYIW